MENKKFKGILLVCDMDGTLLNSYNQISTENLMALNRFVDKGGLFTVATGRIETSVAHYLDSLPINAPAILYNGAMIYDFGTGQVLWDVRLPQQAAHVPQIILQSFPGLGVEIYKKGKVYLSAENAWTLRHLQKEQISFERSPALENISEPWQKVLLAGDPAEIDQVEIFLNQKNLPFMFVRSEEYFLEILPPGINKGAALLFLTRYLGLPPSRVVAVGDNPNDREMLETAGFGVAVGNAHVDIKKIASFCSSDNDQHAVAEVVSWMEQNMLKMLTGDSKDEIRISGDQTGARNGCSNR